jgi:ankyrin repeat protein
VNIVNLQGRSPLRIALLEGNLDLAGLLLDNGANIDYLDNDSRLEKENLCTTPPLARKRNDDSRIY